MDAVQKKTMAELAEVVMLAGAENKYLLGLAEGMAIMARKQAAKAEDTTGKK